MLDEEAMAVSVKVACHMIGIGKTTVYRLINSSHLEAVKIGSKTVITMASIKKLLRAGKEAA